MEAEWAKLNPNAKKDDDRGGSRGVSPDSTSIRSSGPPPGKRDPNRLWCSEHDVYEDECLICHPELKNKPANEGAAELMCKEHNVPEKECGICHPELAPDLKPGESLKIRQLSRRSAAKAGITTERAQPGESSPGISVFCEVRYNQNQVARITPLAPGVVDRVLVDVGQAVGEGDILVEIASSEIAAAKRDYLLAIVDEKVKSFSLAREEQLLAKKISAEAAYQKAEAEHEMARAVKTTARQTLLNYRFTDAEIRQIEGTKSSSSLMYVRAPYAGTLVEREAVVGEAVEPGAKLFTLADLSTMWLELAVPENQIASVHPGQVVEGTFSGLPGLTIQGELIWIDSRVDERTRLVKARALVPNPDAQLKSGMFGVAKVVFEKPVSMLRLPPSALQRFEGQPYVFVKKNEDLFQLRRVIVGAKDAHSVEILAGILATDEVVVSGGFTMKSEFLKSRLGAGCVDD
ncbi:MAG: efflux RND transporter periplasmic adaptor subunit [Phycisphaerae bacterium]|nr:efflux RND transporter periplasmic adaptor subunit [Phycisphaerae bacterium]